MRKQLFATRHALSLAAMSLALGSSMLLAKPAASLAGLTMIPRDTGFKFEAEAWNVAATSKVVEDATASGGKYIVADGTAKNPKMKILEFKFAGKRHMDLEMYLRLKVEGKGKVRFYYATDKSELYPREVQAGDGWQMCQIARMAGWRTEPHGVRVYSNDPRLKIDSLHFENCATDTLPESTNLRVLPPVRRKSRIVFRDINYVPEKVGDAIVCLWKNDAIGCATYTIDDNLVGEIPWWMATAKKYDVRLTWFIITRGIGKGHPVAGSWDDFRKVLAAGHDVQSHTYTHLGDNSLLIDEEYAKAVEAIEKNLPGHKVQAVAYPGGGRMGKNLPEVSKRYHLASRGVVGLPNTTGKTDFMCTNSFTSQNMDPNNWSGLPNMVKKNPRWPNSYRAWHCHHFHSVRPNARKQVDAAMAFYKEHKVWVPSFVDAAKYGQERDSASLKTLSNKADRIVLSLKDHMDDSLFDLPLTLRVHVADDWKGAIVTQNGKTQTVKVIDINGKKTLMFDAVPDRGNITVSKAD